MSEFKPPDFPTCSTCAHWVAFEHWDREPHWKSYGECQAVHADPSGEALPPAVTTDHGGLVTLPSFGCLLHSDLAEASA